MITEKDARAGAARDMGSLAELDFQIRDNHKYDSPNNPCCWMPIGCEYETEADK